MAALEGIVLDKEGNQLNADPVAPAAARVRVFRLGPVTGPLIGGAVVLAAIFAGITLIGILVAGFIAFLAIRSLFGILVGFNAPRPARPLRPQR